MSFTVEPGSARLPGLTSLAPRRPLARQIQPFNPLDQRLRKNADFGGLVAPALIREIDGEARQLPVFQNGHETPSHDIVVDDIERLNHDTHARIAGGTDDLTFARIPRAP